MPQRPLTSLTDQPSFRRRALRSSVGRASRSIAGSGALRHSDKSAASWRVTKSVAVRNCAIERRSTALPPFLRLIGAPSDGFAQPHGGIIGGEGEVDV